ncbi:MAG: glycosyltransferase [Pyrinomonadaceae bacterium]
MRRNIYSPRSKKSGAGLADIDSQAEIIVVDNESEDKTLQIAKDFGAKVFTETKHNIARVRNTGAKNTSGDVLIFVDADTLVPVELFNKIINVMHDKKCLGGAVAVEYEKFERNWMKFYLFGWKFWGKIFNMKQGATQFCRKSVFFEISGYDESTYMGEDVKFYWQLSKYAAGNNGYLYFIENPKVVTSARRFNKMSVWKTLLLTHPFYILLTSRRKKFWKDWYEKVIR